MHDWDDYANVFTSILTGSLFEDLDQFTDDELRPFLPLLIASSFGSSSSPQYAVLVGRLASFSEGNRCLQLLSMDYTELQMDLKSPKQPTYPYEGSSDYIKIKLLLSALLKRDQKDDKSLANITTEEKNLKEVILLTQIAYLKMPTIFDVDQVVFRAIGVPNGAHLITGLISNAPELLEPVLTVLKAVQISDECARGRERGALFDLIFCLYPATRWSVINDIAKSRRDALLSIRLATTSPGNEEELISFLTSQLLHRDSDTLTSQLIAKSPARPTLNAVYERLFRIAKETLKSSPTQPQTELLRLIVFLQQHCVAKLNAEQMYIFCGLLSRTVGNDSHVIFSVAIIMSIQSLTLSLHQAGVMGSVDERILNYFQWLKEIVQSNSRPFLSQHLMYIAACVYSKQRDQLNTMFSELLRIKITIQPRHLDALASIMHEHFLKSEEIARECTKLSITPNLNANSGHRLPINTVYLCFLKESVDIAPWLEAQLCSCLYPMHTLLPELIERFAMMATRNKLPGLSKQFVQAAFEGEVLDEKTVPLRVLCFLFLLSYRSNLDQLGAQAFEIHGPEIFTKLPARYLLSVVMSRTKDFGPIQAPLIRLSTDICPYMLPTVASVNAVKNKKQRALPLRETSEQLNRMLDTPGELHTVVRKLHLAPISDQVNNVKALARAFSASLDETSPVALVDAIVSMYKSLKNFVPRMLYEISAIEWAGGSAVTLLLVDIYEYPSLLFRCNRRIFSSPPHFRCFINLLEFFMQASRNNLQRKIHAANVNSKNDTDRQDRDALSITFDNTQSSLIVQLLIEVSDEKKMRDDLNDEAVLIRRRKIREIACEFIHQMFITDPHVLKLVLFQGIPLHMIRSLVEGIPSMYVALESLQEMMCLPDINRRICAVALMVNISRKYRVLTCHNMTDFILNILNTLLRYSESFLNIKLFIKIVPTLAEVISIFPQLSGDITSLLLRVSAMAKARLALQPLVIRPDCEEKYLMNLVTKSLSEQIEAQAW